MSSISGGFDSSNDTNKNTENKDASNDFDYFVLSNPKDLLGINLLWEIIFCNNNDKVVESCLSFLVNLYLNLDESESKESFLNARSNMIINLVN